MVCRSGADWWAVQLDLSKLEYVKQEDDWNKLVLPKGHREIVQAMVETHSGGWRWGTSDKKDKDKIQMDLVRGKGEWLFGLSRCTADNNCRQGLYYITPRRAGCWQDVYSWQVDFLNRLLTLF